MPVTKLENGSWVAKCDFASKHTKNTIPTVTIQADNIKVLKRKLKSQKWKIFHNYREGGYYCNCPSCNDKNIQK